MEGGWCVAADVDEVDVEKTDAVSFASGEGIDDLELYLSALWFVMAVVAVVVEVVFVVLLALFNSYSNLFISQ